jgi:glycosyltransferase involved in cell wall biosynthesis
MAKKRQRRASSSEKVRGRLLVISYFFPPTAGGGVFRPLAMVKYLSGLGWRITVLTATTPRHYPVDPALERRIPPGVDVVRQPVIWEGSLVRRAFGALNLGWLPRNLITPDERIFWAEKAERRARKLLREEPFDCLYTTGPPFSVLVCGLWLKRETKMPWIAEFRDPWTLAPYLTIPNALHRRFARDAEEDIVRSADAVVMVTPTFTRMMRERYPDFTDKVHCVPNGFDSEDFSGLGDRGRHRNEACTVVASGTVFGRYNMDDFLKGLEELKKSTPGVYSKLRVVFQGLPDYRLNRRLLESGLNDRCSSRGFVPHAENVRDLLQADLLVLPLAPVQNAEGHVPSRAYEYLAGGTPILAICPDGDLWDLLSAFPHITRVRPGDTKAVAHALEEAVSRWERGFDPPEVDWQLAAGLTRERRAMEMDSIIASLVARRKEAG